MQLGELNLPIQTLPKIIISNLQLRPKSKKIILCRPVNKRHCKINLIYSQKKYWHSKQNADRFFATGTDQGDQLLRSSPVSPTIPVGPVRQPDGPPRHNPVSSRLVGRQREDPRERFPMITRSRVPKVRSGEDARPYPISARSKALT